MLKIQRSVNLKDIETRRDAIKRELQRRLGHEAVSEITQDVDTIVHALTHEADSYSTKDRDHEGSGTSEPLVASHESQGDTQDFTAPHHSRHFLGGWRERLRKILASHPA